MTQYFFWAGDVIIELLGPTIPASGAPAASTLWGLVPVVPGVDELVRILVMLPRGGLQRRPSAVAPHCNSADQKSRHQPGHGLFDTSRRPVVSKNASTSSASWAKLATQWALRYPYLCIAAYILVQSPCV